MLNQEQRAAFQQALMQICASRGYTYRRNEGHMIVWQCDQCGTLVKDNPRNSHLGWFHQKPVQQEN